MISSTENVSAGFSYCCFRKTLGSDDWKLFHLNWGNYLKARVTGGAYTWRQLVAGRGNILEAKAFSKPTKKVGSTRKEKDNLPVHEATNLQSSDELKY